MTLRIGSLALASLLLGCQPTWRMLPPGGAAAEPLPAGHSIHEERHPETRSVILRQVLLNDGEGGQLRDGLEEAYWPDGSPRSRRQFDRGVPVGAWRSWWRDGTLRSEQLIDPRGGPTPLRFFHPSGALQAEGQARGDGSRQGAWRFLRADGELEKEGAYLDGLPSGPWTYYGPGGAILAQGTYEAGERVGSWWIAPDSGE